MLYHLKVFPGILQQNHISRETHCVVVVFIGVTCQNNCQEKYIIMLYHLKVFPGILQQTHISRNPHCAVLINKIGWMLNGEKLIRPANCK